MRTPADSRPASPALVLGGTLLAVAVGVFVTEGTTDFVLLLLAVGLLIVSHEARRYAREELVYRTRGDPRRT